MLNTTGALAILAAFSMGTTHQLQIKNSQSRTQIEGMDEQFRVHNERLNELVARVTAVFDKLQECLDVETLFGRTLSLRVEGASRDRAKGVFAAEVRESRRIASGIASDARIALTELRLDRCNSSSFAFNSSFIGIVQKRATNEERGRQFATIEHALVRIQANATNDAERTARAALARIDEMLDSVYGLASKTRSRKGTEAKNADGSG